MEKVTSRTVIPEDAECDWVLDCRNKPVVAIGGEYYCAEHREAANDAYQDYLSMPEFDI